MPVQVSYPGVYIEEIPSGVRTITGVATSITAFIGRALRGPVNRAVTINSFADFERTFGGLGVNYPMSYSVRDFYLNGGSQAIIVRLFKTLFPTEKALTDAKNAVDETLAAINLANTVDAAVEAAKTAKDAEINQQEPRKSGAGVVADAVTKAAQGEAPTLATLKTAAEEAAKAAKTEFTKQARHTSLVIVGSLTLEAASPGPWGDVLRARIDRVVSDDVAKRLGLTAEDLFSLTIKEDTPIGREERFLNVSLKESARRIDRVLEAQSTLVRWHGEFPAAAALPELPSPSNPADDIMTIAEQELAAAEQALNDAKKAGKEVTELETKLGTAKTKLAGEKAKSGVLSTLEPLDRSTYGSSQAALEKADLFNLLCIPPDTRDGSTEDEVYRDALAFCVKRRAMLIVDPRDDWAASMLDSFATKLSGLGLSGPAARNAALYFPRVLQSDPLRDGQIGAFVPCGIVAGVMARTDTQRGVWKAPAGLDAALNGVQGLQVNLTDPENGMLNPLGVNCLRSFGIAGRVVWGARTLRGADLLADEYKYVPVRRLALYIEESLFRGTQWVVFEPNDEPLWAQIRLNVGAFMHNLFRQGAFQGTTPRDAYFVKCDRETTPQPDINLGIVNIVVGFAPLKPAEFVIIKLQQIAGQIET